MVSEHLYNQPFPVFNHPHRKSFLFHLKVVSWFFNLCQITSCPVTEHHWKEFGSIFSLSPFPVRSLYTLVRSPEPSFLYSLSSFSLSSYDRCSHPLLILAHQKYKCDLTSNGAKLDQSFLLLKYSHVFLQASRVWPYTVISHSTSGNKPRFFSVEHFTSETSHILLSFIIFFQIVTWLISVRKF